MFGTLTYVEQKGQLTVRWPGAAVTTVVTSAEGAAQQSEAIVSAHERTGRGELVPGDGGDNVQRGEVTRTGPVTIGCGCGTTTYCAVGYDVTVVVTTRGCGGGGCGACTGSGTGAGSVIIVWQNVQLYKGWRCVRAFGVRETSACKRVRATVSRLFSRVARVPESRWAGAYGTAG